MFCSQCGKKVMESMLFCPFCGSPIVIPNQEALAHADDEEFEQEEAADQEIIEEIKFARVPVEPGKLDISINWDTGDSASTAQTQDEEEEADEDEPAFVPLDLNALEREITESGVERDVSGEISELLSSQLNEEPVRLEGHVPDLTNVKNPAKARPRTNGKNTYAPVKAFNPDDIFLDGEDEEDYDDYEDEEDYEEEDYDYEEPEYGGFFSRHIRGLVALLLLVVVIAIIAGWALSDGGQISLANANLAWRPTAYETLGYQAYQKGSFALSAGYYEKALDREADNYDYAYSAGIAYYMAGDITRSAEMGRRAVEINPSKADAYQLLLRLYPDAATRPWDVSALLQKGYQLTGDASLNVEG